MKLMYRPLLIMPAVAVIVAALAPSTHAQRAGFIRLFRPYHQVALAQLTEIEKDLKLTDEQKDKMLDLYDTLNEERGALWQEAAGDFESIRDDMAKLNNDIAEQFNEALDETQQGRLQEIYAQANGPTALFDAKIAETLKITEEQATKLAELRTKIFDEFRNAGVDWQSLSDEEATKKVDEMIATQNDMYATVMTDEQRAEFEKLKGEKLEIDLGNLPNPFGG